MFACIISDAPAPALLELAREWSPRVQTVAHGLILDLTGLARLLGPPEEIAQRIAQRASGARVAVAANPDAAICAARAYPGVTAIRPGHEMRLLGELPLQLLAPPDGILSAWHLSGLHTFRDLAALPREELAVRLGAAGIEWQRRARGALERPLLPEIAAPEYVRCQELEFPVAESEPLLFLFSGMLGELCAELDSRGLAADELHYSAKLLTEKSRQETKEAIWERSLRLPCPMRDQKSLLKLLQLDLEKHPPPAEVVALELRATPAPPQRLQRGLFTPAAPEPEKLEITLARLARLIGEDRLGSPELLDTHRRDAFRLAHFQPPAQLPEAPEIHETKLALRRFRPPLPARVRGVPPAFVAAQGIQGRVEASAGPWRSSGDWWNAAKWSRDEWDVALVDGMYRIFVNLDTNAWYIDGMYD